MKQLSDANEQKQINFRFTEVIEGDTFGQTGFASDSTNTDYH